MAKDDLVVVGIGSSAGGLEALQIMLSNLPEIPNCAYVIAQHLSPTHKSMMVELLARTTDIPVIEVKNGLRIKPKTIYMTPENTDIYVKDCKIYLKTVEQSFGPKPSVNYFFSTLAQSFNEKAIGIILSGTGSDGAYGIRAIKAEGGITIAQAPATAKYDGMPLSAINTGKVDLVVPIEKLGFEIGSIVLSLDKKLELSLNDRILQQIYRILFDEHGVDFSLYKKNTIIRRIERRLSALKIESLIDYIKILENSEEEVTILYHDILIGVTSFFRDKEAFVKLQDQIQTIVSKKEQGEEIRFWSIGCSTGEEAYSIAIILSELLKEKLSKYKIKVFATDIDDEALKIARAGVYAETSFEGVDKNIIKKYFSVQKNQFEIKKTLRELVIFSKHNITSDSPFLRLDMISCRNMLIYFGNSLQNKFFPIVHYALKDNGILFLGKSESIGQHIDLFNLIDKNAKIFKAQFTGIKEPPKLYNYSSSHKSATLSEPKVMKVKNEEEFLEDVISEAVREVLLKRCVVINSSNDIVYLKGDNPYLKPREGKISNNIFRQLSDEISLDLRSVLNKASKEKSVEMTPFRPVNVFEDVIRYLRIIVTPVEDDKSDDWLYILFFQAEESQNIKGHIVSNGDESEVIEKLTLELESTKSHLQNVIEELETSYEEMQSLNEELQSSNEELQSSNEELETTNEELQSTNEELQTAYSELRVLYEDKEKRTKQLEDLAEKLSEKTEDNRKQKEITEAILDTAPIAITMVDKNGNIIYANNQALDLFEITKDDIVSRKYNSREWKIRSFTGEEFDEEKLPFSIIKRTYEPVYSIKHCIEDGRKKLYLSISGAPQFDYEGKFQGAVFCIENLTDSLTLQNDIASYKNSLNYQVEKEIKEGDSSLLEMSLLDITSDIRNILSDLSLDVNSIEDTKDSSGVIELTNQRVNEISKILDDRTEYYTQSINYDRESLLLGLERFTRFFDIVFQSNNIDIKLKVNRSIDKFIESKKLHDTLYNVFNLFIQLKDTKGKSKLVIVNTLKDDKYLLNFDSNIIIESEKNRLLVEKANDSNIKIDIDSKKELIISLEV